MNSGLANGRRGRAAPRHFLRRAPACADKPFLGKRPRGQGTADAQRAQQAQPGERAFAHTTAQTSINPIQPSLQAGLGPEGCAWYPATLASHARREGAEVEGGEQDASGLRTRESKAGLVGVCVWGGGVSGRLGGVSHPGKPTKTLSVPRGSFLVLCKVPDNQQNRKDSYSINTHVTSRRVGERKCRAPWDARLQQRAARCRGPPSARGGEV